MSLNQEAIPIKPRQCQLHFPSTRASKITNNDQLVSFKLDNHVESLTSILLLMCSQKIPWSCSGHEIEPRPKGSQPRARPMVCHVWPGESVGMKKGRFHREVGRGWGVGWGFQDSKGLSAVPVPLAAAHHWLHRRKI